ncbi:hypothetical protein V9T40_010548 [Parthenolecanium corni]|uniref:Uncharacterized protein n=1 Tax=Parthenolecanium corni TaxID=536013 RepID=A0AAN9XXL5_9HEMI
MFHVRRRVAVKERTWIIDFDDDDDDKSKEFGIIKRGAGEEEGEGCHKEGERERESRCKRERCELEFVAARKKSIKRRNLRRPTIETVRRGSGTQRQPQPQPQRRNELPTFAALAQKYYPVYTDPTRKLRQPASCERTRDIRRGSAVPSSDCPNAILVKIIRELSTDINA